MDTSEVVPGGSGRDKGKRHVTLNCANVCMSSHGTLGASSDGGASVFSQRSAATKSSSATGKSGAAAGGNAAVATGKSGLAGIPRAAIEGSAFVIPAQEVTLA